MPSSKQDWPKVSLLKSWWAILEDRLNIHIDSHEVGHNLYSLRSIFKTSCPVPSPAQGGRAKSILTNWTKQCKTKRNHSENVATLSCQAKMISKERMTVNKHQRNDKQTNEHAFHANKLELPSGKWPMAASARMVPIRKQPPRSPQLPWCLMAISGLFRAQQVTLSSTEWPYGFAGNKRWHKSETFWTQPFVFSKDARLCQWITPLFIKTKWKKVGTWEFANELIEQLPCTRPLVVAIKRKQLTTASQLIRGKGFTR